jgi:subtilisin family serine protease
MWPASPPDAAEQPWTFLPIEDVGARRFLEANPDYDGRGVVVAVLDTGVDMSIPGLVETSQGLVKVVDARDFTGRGKIELQLAERVEGEGSALEVEDGLWLEGVDQLTVKPEGDDRLYTGVLEEEGFRNSAGLQDLDDDGRTDARWGLVVYAASREEALAALGPGRGVEDRWTWGEKALQTEEKDARSSDVWIVVIDTDRDGDLLDETLLRDYAVDYQSFNFQRKQMEDARQVLQLSVDLRIQDDEPELRLHYDDGAHGSHVAGIATGFNVHGQAGLNGVAPGARVISCKLGDNSLSGGCTRTESMKKAYEFAAEYQERYGVPVVVNMSYGIGSEIEGDADMEKFLDELMDDHSELVVCTSAGNEGPGISTVGLPAASNSVISAAALLTKEAARDLYGASFTRDELFGFSSRGGEALKPDIAAPGAASSTVPFWDSGDRMAGTSMASPQVAGSVACMLSGLVAEELEYNFGTIKRSIVASGQDLPGYSRIEVGGGVLDLPAAFEAAKAYARAGEAGLVTTYEIETTAPFQPDGEANAAYWRTGGWFPAAPETQRFTIRPRFATEMSEDDQEKFYRAYRLRSDTSWIKLDKKDTYISGDASAQVNLSYDANAVTEPGVHVGRVVATEKGGDRKNAAAYEFELMTTIVVPYKFEAGSGFARGWKGHTLNPGQHRRYFIQVPTGATSMDVELAVADEEKARVQLVLHDPQGRRYRRTGFLTLEGAQSHHRTVTGSELLPGTWEVVAVAAFSPGLTSTYDLTVQFAGFTTCPPVVKDLDYDEPGTDPKISLKVTPVLEQRFLGSAQGEIDHFWREKTADIEDTDIWTYEFHVDESVRRIEFDLELSQEIYNRMTDCAVNIANSSGEYLVADGFGHNTLSTAIDASPGDYTLEVIAGFSRAEHKESWQIEVEERHILKDAVHLSGTAREDATFSLYPSVSTEVEFVADGVPPRAPEGFSNAGELRWTDSKHRRVRLRVPIRLGS